MITYGIINCSMNEFLFLVCPLGLTDCQLDFVMGAASLKLSWKSLGRREGTNFSIPGTCHPCLEDSTPCMVTAELSHHRIMESQKGPQRSASSNPLHGLVAPHPLRLPRAPSSMALSISRAGASTAFLGSSARASPTLWVRISAYHQT